jgi:hypothetical protein
VNETMNLAAVEGRAYEWALREPAMIPYWMHETKGLSETGVKLGDDDPWYVKHGRGQPVHAASVRPPKQDLPDYLEHAQNTINHLLELGSRRTEQQQTDLEEYMEEMEPKALRKLHERYRRKAEAYLEKQKIWDAATEEEDRDYYQNEFDSARKKYEKKARKWRNTFGSDGVQFMVEDPGKRNAKAPGVFYFPDENTLDPEVEVAVDTFNDSILMEAYQYGWKSVHLGLKMIALLLLWKAGVFTEESRDTFLSATEGTTEKEQNKKAVEIFSTPMNEVCKKYREVRVLKPGELKPPEGRTLWLKFMPSDEYLEGRRKLEEEVEVEGDATAVGATKDAIDSIDWRPKAERRGIQRAAIELALNLFCANHEQHRPKDKFRRLELPGPYVSTDFQDISLSIPLEPHKRPVEMDTFEYTKKLAKYHHDVDLAYRVAREKVLKYDAIELSPPVNHRGPFEVGTAETMLELFQKKLTAMYELYEALNETSRRAPRPIIQRMLTCVEEGLHLPPGVKHEFMIMRADENSHEMEVVDLSKAEIELLEELTSDSWDEVRKPFALEDLKGWSYTEFEELLDFRDAVEALGDEIPVWESLKPRRMSKSQVEQFMQIPHDPEARGKKGLGIPELTQALKDAKPYHFEHYWSEDEVIHFLRAMKENDAIQ